jgi:hypothetical protein
MSAITTGGWGAQGGLITARGWGGAGRRVVRPSPVRLRPEITASFQLRPLILSAGDIVPIPRFSGTDLRPRLGAGRKLARALVRSKQVLPRITTGPLAGQRGPSFGSAQIRPQTSSQAGQKGPAASARELRPTIASGARARPQERLGASELRPKITDSEGD